MGVSGCDSRHRVSPSDRLCTPVFWQSAVLPPPFGRIVLMANYRLPFCPRRWREEVGPDASCQPQPRKRYPSNQLCNGGYFRKRGRVANTGLLRGGQDGGQE